MKGGKRRPCPPAELKACGAMTKSVLAKATPKIAAETDWLSRLTLGTQIANNRSNKEDSDLEDAA